MATTLTRPSEPRVRRDAPDDASRAWTAPGRAYDFWSIPADRLLDELATSARGLDAPEAVRRRSALGSNLASSRALPNAARLLASQFASPITVLLLVAALLSLVAGERVDGLIILGILVVGAALGFWQERRAADAVAQLLALVRTTCTVLRDGRACELPVEDVVPGDIVRLDAGSSVPGDARVLQGNDLHVDQAALTGESFPAEKDTAPAPASASLAERRNVLWLGTHVVSGTGTAVVVRTGRATELGDVAGRLSRAAPETEFERGVRRFGYLLLEIATALVIVIFAINTALGRPVLEALLFTLALAVGLTPQLLPAIVGVTLAQGARHMARERVIVRRLTAIEDLGGMEVLCTDKTGTLTQGIVSIHSAEDWRGAASARTSLYAHLNAAFASGVTNPIDIALRAAPPSELAGWTKVDEVPYDFVRRRLSVAVRDAAGRRILVTKGALAAVLDACAWAEDADGSRVPLDDVREAVSARFEALSRRGYRCLGVAWRPLAGDAPVSRADERALTFVGILCLSDPLKEDAPAALRELAGLGVRVVLVSGDNRHVAARVADEAGLPAGTVLTGDALRTLSEDALVTAAPQVRVFAEVDPVQKERVIRALRQGGRAVGFLGDGINDAAALHAADVGISVDSAADVTRQAADIVLLDKDLAALGRGVREGRRAFANTLTYVFITTSANFGNMFSMAGASLFAGFLPFLPKQILLLNVLTDVPAMAIATDHADAESVERPRRWDTRAIRRFMVVFGLVSSAFDFLTFGTLLGLRVAPATFRTAWFVESVVSELVILLVIRTRRSVVRSRVGALLLWSSVAVAALTLVLPYSPLAALFGLAPLSPTLLALMLGIVLAFGGCAELVKRVAFRWVTP